MKSHQQLSIGMNPQPRHITKLANHLHTSHTTIMNLQFRPTSLMSQPKLHGLHTLRSLPQSFTGMTLDLLPINMMKSHHQLLNITTGNLLLSHTATMNQPQLSGLLTMNNQLSTFTHMNHSLRATHMFLNHLHTNHTTTGNHQLNLMLNTAHPQLPGLIIMNNQLLNFTHMNHTLRHTHMFLSHLHTNHTSTGNHQLKNTTLMNHHQQSGATHTQLRLSTGTMNQL